MFQITSTQTTNNLLKLYLLKLQNLGLPSLEFEYEQIQSILTSNEFNNIDYQELYQHCKLKGPNGGEGLLRVLPESFYFLGEIPSVIDLESLDTYPFPYVSIEQIEGMDIYKANYGVSLGFDLVNENGSNLYSIILNSTQQNYYIEVLSPNIIRVTVFENYPNYLETVLFLNDDTLLNLNEIKDKQLILEIVSENGDMLQHVADEFKSNREVVITAITNIGSALKFASGAFKADKEIVLEASKKDIWNLQFADEELIKSDKDIFLVLLQKVNSEYIDHEYAFKYLSSKHKSDKEVMLAVLAIDGLALKYASEILKADKEVVLTAVKENIGAFQYASKDLKSDIDVIQAARLNE